MSGLIPDLASWALRGQSSDDNTNSNNETENANAEPTETLSPEELRAQRLQRMELMQQRQREQEQAAAAAAASSSPSSGPEPMDIDNNKPPAASPTKPKPTPAPVAPATSTSSTEKKKKRKAEDKKDNDPAKKLQRKKEIILRKVLSIVLEESSLPGAADSKLTRIPVGPTVTVAEILALQVAAPTLGPTATTTNHAFGTPASTPQTLLAYLADCHRKAAEELKTMRNTSASSKKESAMTQEHNQELMEILMEIQKQVVSYAATVLMEPDLFTLGKESSMQLAKCLYTSLSDLSASITFGVGGSAASSFYFGLVEELLSQDPASLERVVQDVLQTFTKALEKCESVLDSSVVPAGWMGNVPVGTDTSPMALVSALTALCMHKKVAEMVARSPHFLLPPVNSTEAAQVIRPPPPPQLPGGGNRNQLLQQFMALAQQQHQPSYKKRSGPALEKNTLLGLCLRVGIPTKNNSAFAPASILRQSLSAVESATSQQRQQLRLYQEACNQFIHHLIKSGKGAREQVLSWFTDAILVNVGASATRPDPSKVSGQNTLINISTCLLKLCEPFVTDSAKHKLIDPQFCSVESAHKGVYATEGDDAVPRLGQDEEQGTAMTDEYNPKNAFVTQLFFLTARSVHYGLASSLSQHETLLRQLSHLHWMITSRGSSADLQSDPQFAMYVSRQRAQEVALFQEDIVADHLRFLQLTAKVLYEMDGSQLKTMPEDFVSDVCDVITSVAKLKAKLLRGIDVSYTFKLVVKLLSPMYASMVRNYNLRAVLGDVLYELFLPPDDSRDRRDNVPTSVYVDSRTGETFLLSDPGAQETLAPSLLLLYGEVEHTGYYDRMSHRAKISSLIKYLWESKQHRPAFRRITQNKDSFIKFANGIMNETNTLIATVMQKLPEIREAQLKMKNPQEWGALNEEQQKQISERLEENEREVKHALPLCNKTLQMFGYLNTDEDIRKLFLLEELCSRLVAMLLHVMTKLVGSKGLELKVDNPEELEFKPKVMLRDLCLIFGLFAKAEIFQEECAKSGCQPDLLRSALKPVKKLNLLQGEQLEAFESFTEFMDAASKRVAQDESLFSEAPDEFLDAILSTYMKDPVILPSGHIVDRPTIAQHLLNDPIDPFNRQPMSIDDVKPATELKEKMDKWLQDKRAAQMSDD